MGIFDNVDFTIKEKAKRGMPLPAFLSVKNIAWLWSDDDREQDVLTEAMQRAIESRILRIQPGSYYSTVTKLHGKTFDYSAIINDKKSIRVAWIYDDIPGLCADIDPVAKISKSDFIDWLKIEGEPLPRNCLLETWWKDSELPALMSDSVSLISTETVNDNVESLEDGVYDKRKTSFNNWREQSKIDISSLKVELIYTQVKQFDKQEWNVGLATFKRDFWQKYSKEYGLNKKSGRPPKNKFIGD